jgi:hypothetical protein
VLEEMNGEIASVKSALQDERRNPARTTTGARGISTASNACPRINRASGFSPGRDPLLAGKRGRWRRPARNSNGLRDFIGALQERMTSTLPRISRIVKTGRRSSNLSFRFNGRSSLREADNEKLALLDHRSSDKGERVERSLADLTACKDFEGDVSYRIARSMGESATRSRIWRNSDYRWTRLPNGSKASTCVSRRNTPRRGTPNPRGSQRGGEDQGAQAALEKELNDSRPGLDNVSQKLKMFEDEFIVVLKERSDSMGHEHGGVEKGS